MIYNFSKFQSIGIKNTLARIQTITTSIRVVVEQIRLASSRSKIHCKIAICWHSMYLNSIFLKFHWVNQLFLKILIEFRNYLIVFFHRMLRKIEQIYSFKQQFIKFFRLICRNFSLVSNFIRIVCNELIQRISIKIQHFDLTFQILSSGLNFSTHVTLTDFNPYVFKINIFLDISEIHKWSRPNTFVIFLKLIREFFARILNHFFSSFDTLFGVVNATIYYTSREQFTQLRRVASHL